MRSCKSVQMALFFLFSSCWCFVDFKVMAWCMKYKVGPVGYMVAWSLEKCVNDDLSYLKGSCVLMRSLHVCLTECFERCSFGRRQCPSSLMNLLGFYFPNLTIYLKKIKKLKVVELLFGRKVLLPLFPFRYRNLNFVYPSPTFPRKKGYYLMHSFV